MVISSWECLVCSVVVMCWMWGTVTCESSVTTYCMTVTTFYMSVTTFYMSDRKVSGWDVSSWVCLRVWVCSGGRSLMSDEYVNENCSKLYEGIGSNGSVLRWICRFPVEETLVCWYVFGWNKRFEGDDCYGDGWDSVRGYSVNIDLW